MILEIDMINSNDLKKILNILYPDNKRNKNDQNKNDQLNIYNVFFYMVTMELVMNILYIVYIMDL
mgnify:CR=1 FL=1